jgi:hypothetical protein
MADVVSVQEALASLRDVADDQSRAENPDLKPVAEAFNRFHTEWASKADADLKAEQNPDEANADEIASRDQAEDAEVAEVEEPAPAKPTARKANASESK